MIPNLETVFKIGAAPGQLTLAVIIWLLLLFNGCSVGPDYVRPTAPVPEAYKEMPGWKVAQPMDKVSRGAWWEIYNDRQLNALEAQIDISNQNMAAAEANFRQAVALIRVARAAFFPTVTGGPSWSRFKRSENIGSRNTNLAGPSGTSGLGGSSAAAGAGGIGAFPGATLSDYLLEFPASWELDIWGKVRRSVESATATAQSSAANIEVARLSAQATLAQSYFMLRSLDEQKRLFDATVMAYQKIYDMNKNRYDAGVASRADVAQAETQLKSTKAQAIDLGVQRAQLEHAIAILIGKPPATISIPPAMVALKVPPIPVGVPSQLLERRPDIAAAERNMAAANAQIGVAIAAYYPTITLSSTGGFEASTTPLWFTWPSRFWSLGAAAAQTIFQGGALVAQTEAARAAYDTTVATYRQTVLTGFQEVEDNLSSLRILQQESKAQDDAVRAARQSLMVSTNQYKAGTIGYLDLMVVQTVAFNNERAAIVILGNRMTASVLLIKALGGGWKSSDLPPVATQSPQSVQSDYASNRLSRLSGPANLKVAEAGGKSNHSGMEKRWWVRNRRDPIPNMTNFP